MTKERRLGRGLEALLGQIPSRAAPAAPATVPFPGGSNLEAEPGVAHGTPESYAQPLAATHGAAAANPPRLPIDEIARNPAQPRRDFGSEELAALSESISAHGLLQPVVVRRAGDGYELIAGERRLRAAEQAGMDDVPVHVVEVDERASAELAIVENLHRKDLNALEKAAAFERYLEQYACTQEELAARLKLDRSTIANLIRLLELPEKVQAALRGGRVTQGHARALLPLGDEQEQIAFCERIEREALSVRQVEALVQEAIDAADGEPLAVVNREGDGGRAAKPENKHLAALEQEFRAALGCKVKITHNARGRGKLAIHFRNHDEFDRLHDYLCGEGPAAQTRAG